MIILNLGQTYNPAQVEIHRSFSRIISMKTVHFYPGLRYKSAMMKSPILADRTVRARLDLASHVLQRDVTTICQSKRLFKSTTECFVATLAAEVAVGQYYVERHGEPSFVFGSSFGHHAALVMTRALSYLAALKLVKNFGLAIDQHFSGHITLLTTDLGPDAVKAINMSLGNTGMLTEYTDGIALTLPEALKERSQQLIAGFNGTWQAIPLRLPYHTMAMRQVEPIAKRIFAGLKLRPLRFPLLSTFYATLIMQPKAIRYLFQRLESSPNRIEDCLVHLARQGVTKIVHMKTSEFIERHRDYEVMEQPPRGVEPPTY